jgi:NDP-sugar pyrophosphorylase family protein
VAVERVQVAILCGGLATRMRPLSDTLPKSLFPVAGRPFLDWQLEALARGGASDVVLCTGHLGEAIARHVGDGARFGLRIALSDEGGQRLGTGGALRLARERGLLAPRFVVQYGDSYLELDYRALLDAPGDAVMTVYRNQGQLEASNCVVEDGRVTHYEKGTTRADAVWIDYGAQAIDRELLADAAADLAALYRSMAEQGRLHALPVGARFYEIGSPAGLRALEERLR